MLLTNNAPCRYSGAEQTPIHAVWQLSYMEDPDCPLLLTVFLPKRALAARGTESQPSANPNLAIHAVPTPASVRFAEASASGLFAGVEDSCFRRIAINVCVSKYRFGSRQ